MIPVTLNVNDRGADHITKQPMTSVQGGCESDGFGKSVGGQPTSRPQPIGISHSSGVQHTTPADRLGGFGIINRVTDQDDWPGRLTGESASLRVEVR